MLLVTTQCMEKKRCMLITLLLAWVLETLRPYGLGLGTLASCAEQNLLMLVEVRENNCIYRSMCLRLLGIAKLRKRKLSCKFTLTSIREKCWMQQELLLCTCSLILTILGNHPEWEIHNALLTCLETMLTFFYFYLNKMSTLGRSTKAFLLTSPLNHFL